jgi:toxin CptA
LVSGAEHEVRLAPTTFATLPLVVLNFRCGLLRRRALPVFADALDPEQLRRLRQRLRIEGAALDQASDVR